MSFTILTVGLFSLLFSVLTLFTKEKCEGILGLKIHSMATVRAAGVIGFLWLAAKLLNDRNLRIWTPTARMEDLVHDVRYILLGMFLGVSVSLLIQHYDRARR